jgi:hypothetical protein
MFSKYQSMLPKFEAQKSYSVRHDILFIKCQEALSLCKFVLKDSNHLSGQLIAKTKLNLWSWGEKVTIQVYQDGSVAVISACTVQLVDYGRNQKNVEMFFNTLNNLLGEVSISRQVPAIPSTPSSPSAPPAQPVSQSPSVQILQEHDVKELTKIVGVEELPLDNRFGSDELTVEHEFSKTVRNEVVIETVRELQGKVGFDLFSILKNEICAKLSKQMGQTFEESISRRCTLTFTVRPGDFVTYKVIWKQKYLSGKYEVAINTQPLLVPFNAGFGLEYEISTDKSAHLQSPNKIPS